MSLHMKDIGDVTLVRFIDRILDDPDLKDIVQAAEQRHRRKFLLDFVNVEYMNSAVLGRLIDVQKKLRGLGGRLALCNVIPQILDLLNITKLDKIFPVEETPPEDANEPDDDDEEMLGGVKSRLIPPKPSDKGNVVLPPPPSEMD